MIEVLLICFAVLAALSVGGVVLLDRRLQQLSERLEPLEQLAGLSERVRGLSTELHRKELNERLAQHLHELADAQSRVTAALSELQQQVSDVSRSLERSAQAAAVAPADALSDRVRRHLAAQGYEQVTLLSDLSAIKGGSGRVVFEARRDGVVHKGQLSLAEGEIVDAVVRSAYSAFP
ncbi:MAG: hypothetical protein DRQ55_01865 [Planctomycetota bacterium]|nr:MAG: hypothetical protein DRQ55_01865 [Planctomycetota bacterium]